jgi:hypothetical protein
VNSVIVYTNAGVAVAKFFEPPWKKPPEVYIWGERIFLLRTSGPHAGKYTEASGAFALVNEVPLSVVDQVGSIPLKDHNCPLAGHSGTVSRCKECDEDSIKERT